MICAIYARKSTSQEGVSDEERSVARQVEHARAYAKRKGWNVAEECIFVDDGISGAVFGEKRPGLARLLNALKPRPPFQMLVMSEESRLGREAIETAWTLKQIIIDAGVRVFFYLEDRERTLGTPTDKLLMSVTAFGDEMERERARQRTHDALLQRAKAGHVAGGMCFGYRNERDDRGHVRRVVEPQEAAVVVRIFEMTAAGRGFKAIAAALNAEGALCPTPRRPGRPRGWAQATVRDVLFREAYRGRYVWNKRIRRAKGVPWRPEAEWITADVPGLRIVSDELWQVAHERIAAARAIYFQATGGKAYGRPVNGIESPYLLTGLASCGACGSSLFARRHHHDQCRRAFYGCVVNHQRGVAICKNSLKASMDDTDEAVLAAVEHDVLRVEVLETSLAKALEALRPAPPRARERALRQELARLEVEAQRLSAAIAAGGKLAALVAALQERERRQAQLRAELAAITRVATRSLVDVDEILGQLRESLTDWQGMLRQEPPEARRSLRALLAGRLVFTPRERDGVAFYEFEGPGTITPIIKGLALPTGVVTR